jgi:SAM-dependent methyltransferase
MAFAMAFASGCGGENEGGAGISAASGSPSPGSESASSQLDSALTDPATRDRVSPEEHIEQAEPVKGPSAYAEQELGFPGCADGNCPQHPDSTFVPTPVDIVEKMLELAEVEKDDLVYDLGSGDGRSVIAASRIYGVRSVGVELNPQLAESSRKRVSDQGLSELVEIRNGDMFEVDLSEVDVLVLYQPPKLLERMKPQLAQLRPGARIVSHFFLIPGIEPDETRSLSSEFTNFTHKIHRWNAPLAVAEAGSAENSPESRSR